MPPDTAPFIPSADHSRALRDALACYGTGVTVVTTQTNNGPLGMTANSFSSVSLDPPLVLWSPAVASRRHDAFATAQAFCIHVLSTSQLHLAQHFAHEGYGFDAFDWSPGPIGAPRLSGCLAEFHCRRHAAHPAGDHTVIIGEIAYACQADGGTSGLLFARGQFGQFSPNSNQ